MPTFSPPTHEEPMRTNVRPLNYFRLTYAASVIKINGVYTTVRTPSGDLLTGVEGVDWFLGGRTYTVSGTVAGDLQAAGYSVEWFQNSSFESGLTGWTPYPGLEADTTTAEAHAGSRSLRIVSTGTSPLAVAKDVFQATPVTNYQVSVWCKFSPPSQVLPKLEVYSSGLFRGSVDAADASGWQQLVFQFNSGAAGTIEFLLYPSGINAGPQTTYFDDVSFTEV